MTEIEKLMSWLESDASADHPATAYAIATNAFQWRGQKENLRRKIRKLVSSARRNGYEISCGSHGYFIPRSSRDKRDCKTFLINMGTRVLKTAGNQKINSEGQEGFEL